MNPSLSIIPLDGGYLDLDRNAIVRDGRTEPLTRTEAAVLRYLVSRSGDVVDKKDLLSSVWGYRKGVKTRTVDTYLWRLRRKIEDDPQNPTLLVTEPGRGVRFVAVAQRPALGVVLAAAGVERAFELWRDDPEQTAARWAQTRDALLARADRRQLRLIRDEDGHLLLTGEDPMAALSWTQDSAADAGPLRERLRFALVRVADHEAPEEAVAVERAQRLLEAACGGDTLASGPFARSAPGGGLVEVGRLVLRPGEPPEALYAPPGQVLLPSTTAPKPPPPPERLLGRQSERATLLQWLDEGARAIALTGPGGVGKTALALAFADEVADRYRSRGGVIWVDATPLDDADELPRALAAAMGITGNRAPGEALAARGPCLLILDNLEHLQPDVDRWLRRWDHDAPQVTVLVTSRVRPSSARFHAMVLEPLAPGDAGALFLQLVGSAPGYRRLTPDAPIVQEIISAMAGIPLALELAANRARLLRPERLARRLQDDLLLLGTGDDGADPRSRRTLHDTIAGSLALLEDATQRALRRCAVLRGEMSLDAAEHLIGPEAPGALEQIQRLCDASLLRMRDDLELDEYRLKMYEPIRRHVLRTTPLAEQTAAALRHARWLAQASQGWIDDLRGGRHQDMVLHRLPLEQDHLLRAAALLIEHQDTEAAFDILISLLYLVNFKHTLEPADYLTVLMQLPDSPRRTWLRSAATLHTGQIQDASEMIERVLRRDDLSEDLALEVMGESLESACLINPQVARTRALALESRLAARPDPGRWLRTMVMVAYVFSTSGDAEATKRIHAKAASILANNPGHRWEAAYFTILRMQHRDFVTPNNERALLDAAREMEALGMQEHVFAALLSLTTAQSTRDPMAALRTANRMREMRPEQNYSNLQQAISMIEVAPLMELGRYDDVAERLDRLEQQARDGYRFTSDGRLAVRRSSLELRRLDPDALLERCVPPMTAPRESGWLRAIGWLVAAVAHGWREDEPARQAALANARAAGPLSSDFDGVIDALNDPMVGRDTLTQYKAATLYQHTGMQSLAYRGMVAALENRLHVNRP
ncbi:MAG: winged helix-turn-helix domain-containing protein [Myxococcota bacterium]